MPSNLSNIFIFALCCLLPFVFITIIYVISVQERWQEARQILKDLNNETYDSSKLLPVSRRFLPLFIIASLSMVVLLLCIASLTLAYYLNMPFIGNIDVETLGISILVILLLSAMITFLGLLASKMHKTK